MNDKLFPLIYRDLLQPSAQRIGLSLYKVTDNLVNRVENWCKKLSKDVPNERQSIPEPNISIPALEGLMLNPDGTILNEMFYNILKTSIDKDKEDLNHPAYTYILKQLSKYEAIFICLCNKKTYKYHKCLKLINDKFCDHEIILNEFPTKMIPNDKILFNCSDRLYSLNIGGCFEYDKKALYDNNVQIGVEIFSEFKLLEFGINFAKVCISDECYNILGNY